jgi:UDP-glucuronate 4-epimerase
MRVLVTGAAGFIGYHVSERLLARGDEVIGIDNLNDYYDPALKQARLDNLLGRNRFSFERIDISEHGSVADLFARHKFERVVHLAAQAGVRYSIENPQAYVQSNLVGFANILEGCRQNGIGHLVFASSSSVYGANTAVPFRAGDHTDHPVSLYAATKKANEVLAHSYAHLYRLPVTGLRFFTVYGPWGRPDMAYFSFTRNIIEGKPIDLFNNGNHARDFTYIDDVAEGVVHTLDSVAEPSPDWSALTPDPAISSAPYRLYNIGNNSPVQLNDFVSAIEKATGLKAITNLLPMQMGDVEQTFADIDALSADVGFRPSTPIDEGIEKFVHWYRHYYGK